MGTALIFDSSASSGVLRERGANTAELFDDIATTLMLHRWPAIDMRLLILPGVEGSPPVTSYLALRGTFAESPSRVELVWADPPMWRGAITTEEANDLLFSWGRGVSARVNVNDIEIVRPAYPDRLGATPLASAELIRQGHLGNQAFGLPWDWHFRCWYVSAFGVASHNDPGTVPASVMRAPADWAGASVGSAFVGHLGFDLTHRSNELLQIYLPSPDAIQIGHRDGDRVEVCWYSRSPNIPSSLWATSGAGIWSLRRTRVQDWTLSDAPPGWHGWRQGVPVEATEGNVKVWVGVGDHPWYAVDVRMPVKGLSAQRRHAWAILQQHRPIEDTVRLTPSAAGRNGAAQLETGLGNVLGALGWQVFHMGVITQQEGIDLLAFHEPTGRAIGMSVTLGNDLARKLGHLLNSRQEVEACLSEWSVAWVIATTLDAANTDRGAVENCLRNNVFVLQRNDLRMVEQLDDFSERLDTLWTRDAVAEMLASAEIVPASTQQP
jgi:hypothetical protein